MNLSPLVFKVGGALLRSPEGFKALAQRVREVNGRAPLVLVVSALGRVTRELEQAASVAETRREAEALEIVARLVELHRDYAEHLLGRSAREAFVEQLLQTAAQLEGYVRGIVITGELTPRTLDAVRAFGEWWASGLVQAFLREQGFDVVVVAATELVRTDSRHGMAQPLIEETAHNVQQRLLPVLEPGRVVLTQGFVARSVRGEITTMGQESSALTAALLAVLLRAEEVVMWTDVAGIRQCDPAVVPEAALVERLSYEQALRIARAGLRLLYPRMVELAWRYKLRVRICSAFAPHAGETVVSEEPGLVHPMVVSRERVRLLGWNRREVPAELRLVDVDGSAVLARWEDAEQLWLLTSSDVPAPAPYSREGLLATLLFAQHTDAVLQRCVRLHREGIAVSLWYGDVLRCFVAEEHGAVLIRAMWEELHRMAPCTKCRKAAS